jgi:hypothetical protein
MPHYQLLEEELDRAIERLYRDSEKHKRFHRLLRYAMFGLTALSTVLASTGAFSETYREHMLLAVVITTAIAGVVTSIEGIQKPGDLWLHERRTHYELVDLRRELLFTAKEATETQLWQMFYRMQTVLSASVSSWAKLKPVKESDADSSHDKKAALRLAVKGGAPPSRATGTNGISPGAASDADSTLVRISAPVSGRSRGPG